MNRTPTAAGIPLPPFPSGWYAVASSAELEPGQVEPRHYFGRELVLYRSASGEVSVVDAYCPHLGAHLGPGGPIWSNKRYQPAPTLNEEESAIGHFRRWFRRFYSAETAG